MHGSARVGTARRSASTAGSPGRCRRASCPSSGDRGGCARTRPSSTPVQGLEGGRRSRRTDSRDRRTAADWSRCRRTASSRTVPLATRTSCRIARTPRCWSTGRTGPCTPVSSTSAGGREARSSTTRIATRSPCRYRCTGLDRQAPRRVAPPPPDGPEPTPRGGGTAPSRSASVHRDATRRRTRLRTAHTRRRAGKRVRS
jgi:hypothetical protein